MYNSFFGFTENPFSLTPDPRYLFLSPYHKEAIDHLLYGINERKGFIVITGGIGTGKTTLCRVLLNHLDSRTKSAVIFNSFISDIELLKSVNQEFGIKMDSGSETKKYYIDALNDFLLETFKEGGNAVLLLDEAQNLSHEVLEQIRMLSNLETTKEKLIQIVLVGQPELNEVLSSTGLRQLNERIMVRYDLKPLIQKDIRGYIEHRMVVAGGRGNLRFTGGAIKRIYEYSGGNPRRINSICDRSLLIGYAKGREEITGGISQKAIKEISGNILSGAAASRLQWGKYAFLFLAFIIALGLGVLRYRESLVLLLINHQQKETAAIPVKPVKNKKPEPWKKSATLFIEDSKSLTSLFSLFYNRSGEDRKIFQEHYLSLVRFNLGPEYYITLKKPFRVNLSGDEYKGLYLLIIETGPGGATAIDSEGERKKIPRDFLLKNWGGEVSWIYPPEREMPVLSKGIRGREVLSLQNMLNEIGYLQEPDGIYDDSTFDKVMRFQKDFNLSPDGISGPRTRALLYQMVK